MHTLCSSSLLTCKRALLRLHTSPFKSNSYICFYSGAKATSLKSRSRLVWLNTMKSRPLVKEEPLLQLHCLIQFQIQSFVLYCCFSLIEQSPSPPLLSLAEPSWGASSDWLRGTQGRIWEVLLCLHAWRETPNNNCYCGQRDDLQLSRQTHTQGCKVISHTHRVIMAQLGALKQADWGVFVMLLLHFTLNRTQR